MSMVEPVLLAEIWMSQPQSCKHVITVHITQLSRGNMGGEEMLPHPSMPEADGRPGPETIRAGELSLSPTSYNPQESRSFTSPSSTIEPILLAKGWVSQPRGWEQEEN